MGHLASVVGTAAAVFAGTDLDDLVVLTALFLSARAIGRPRRWQVWTGQYAGIAVLVAVAALAALGLTVVPDRWVALLGLIPLTLGIRGLVAAARATADEPPAVATGVLSVAAVTIANGADNLSVYTPLFRTIGPADTLVTVVVFAFGVAVWCLAGMWLGSHRAVVRLVERVGHWVVPVVFGLVGAIVIARVLV